MSARVRDVAEIPKDKSNPQKLSHLQDCGITISQLIRSCRFFPGHFKQRRGEEERGRTYNFFIYPNLLHVVIITRGGSVVTNCKYKMDLQV